MTRSDIYAQAADILREKGFTGSYYACRGGPMNEDVVQGLFTMAPPCFVGWSVTMAAQHLGFEPLDHLPTACHHDPEDVAAFPMYYRTQL